MSTIYSKKSLKSESKTSKTSAHHKSSSSNKRRSASKSGALPSSLTSTKKSNSPSSTTSKESRKSAINYVEELTMVLFRSLLYVIVESCEILPNETDEPSISAQSFISMDVNEIDEEFLESLDVAMAQQFSSTKKSKSESLQKDQENEEEETTTAIEELPPIPVDSYVESTRTSTGEPSNVSIITSYSGQLNFDNVRVTFKNGNYYQGPIRKTLFHGIGKFVWNDGAEYEGEFTRGEMTGKGTLIYPDLSYCKGEFYKGFINGRAVKFISSSSMIYNGEWKAGRKHGKGWLLYKPGDWYDGDWVSDYYEGVGIRQYNFQEAYEGNWLKGLRHGSGTMIWNNQDVYMGEWKNGLMEGYGQYTWKAILTRTLVFPICNTYKGSWLQGMRDGAGIMDFGTEGGAKLAGVWECNYKHGPGIFLCENGKIVEGNPLFVFDRPANTQSAFIYKKYFVSQEKKDVHNISDEQLENNDDQVSVKSDDDDKCSSIKSTIELISQNMYEKRCNKNLDLDFLTRMQETGDTSYFEPKTEAYQIIGIAMYAPSEEIDISYYLNLVKSKLEEMTRKQSSKTQNPEFIHYNSMIDLNEWETSVATGKKFVQILEAREKPAIKMVQEGITHRFSEEFEEKKIREILIKRMLSLKKIYNYYATLTSLKKINYKVVLVRILMWQFFRDIGLLTYGYSLVELDLILVENPACNFETDHNPFEKIYLWQFIHVILTIAFNLYFVKQKNGFDIKNGVLASAYETFLDEIVLPKFGNSRASCLFEYRDLLPIKSVYSLYRSFGESNTARDFLSVTCTRKHEIPPCYLTFQKEKTERRLYGGFNTASVGDNVIFIKGEEPICRADEEVVPIIEDPLFQDKMIIFRLLGPKRVSKCVAEICPNVVKEGMIVNFNYPLSFIEFYDLLLKCTYMWVNKLRAKERQSEFQKVTIESLQQIPSKIKKN